MMSRRLRWAAFGVGLAVVLVVMAVLTWGKAPADNLPPCDNFKQYAEQPQVVARSADRPAVPEKIAEQYKAYIVDLATVASQFSTTQTFFLTIVAAFLAILAFKNGVRPLRDYLAPVPICVFLIIFLICVDWYLTAERFRSLIAAKFDVLRAMEHDYAGLYPMFLMQTKCYFAHSIFGIIGLQLWLIAVFGLGALAIVGVGVWWQFRETPTVPPSPAD